MTLAAMTNKPIKATAPRMINRDLFFLPASALGVDGGSLTAAVCRCQTVPAAAFVDSVGQIGPLHSWQTRVPAGFKCPSWQRAP